MSDSASPRRSSGGRIAAVIVGSVIALVSLALLAAGGAGLWANGQKDDHGYLSTRTERFHTTTAALRTNNLDVDLGGTATVLDSDLYGKVRLRVTPRTDKDVFVGIAPTRDAARYLRGIAHTNVTDLDYHPFHADYATSGGARHAAAPITQRIWAAQAHGHHTQTLTWKVADGDWSVVVMNADGSPGVDAGVRAGADLPFLAPAGWTSLGLGIVLAVAAAGLIVFGLRRPPSRPAAPRPAMASA
jgi:hypothetical protein